jgi:2-desacetyl-2-hydroxyethyl bacteriochlorophyllide A dehydrogenase
MRALQIQAVGEPLVEVTVPDPAPGNRDVLVRVERAGICRSDVHYRAGTRTVPGLPLVPGHEIAGTVVAAGPATERDLVGRPVCVHYLVTCGVCDRCLRGAEPFCRTGEMIGLDRHGGYAELVVVPERNAHQIPDGVPMEVAAIMMCSTSTSFHALRRAGLAAGESVAVFGAGGLGMSAIQLARLMGASAVYAVDINPVKLGLAERLGAVPVDGADNPVAAITARTGDGVDVALELVGDPEVMRLAVGALAPFGRAIAVGITHREFGLDPFRDLVRRETEIRGASDHLSGEITELLGLTATGDLDLSAMVTNTIPLEAGSVNDALDRLERFGDDVRTVIAP